MNDTIKVSLSRGDSMAESANFQTGVPGAMPEAPNSH